MADPVSKRLPEASNNAVSTVHSNEEGRSEVHGSDPFLELIVSNSTDYRAASDLGMGLRGIQSPLDRLARERVFDSIVRKTLENPEHPYYSLVSPATRKEMIQRITSLLDSSHYLNPVKRQS